MIISNQERLSFMPLNKRTALASVTGIGNQSQPLTHKPGTFKSLSEIIEHANLLQEDVRLKSFALWPGWSYARPEALAETGFYFTGQNDTVKCAECSVELTGWTAGQVPSQVHEDKSPYCPMVTKIGTKNIPKNSSAEPGNGKGKQQKSKGKNSPLAASRNEPEGITGKPNTSPTLTGKDVHGQDMGKPLSSRVVGSNNGSGSFNFPQGDMKDEINRLGTFKGKWPENSPMKPEALAAAGFYFIGPMDRVICAFCRGKVYNWVPGDSAVGEHTRLFPNCTFIQELNRKPLAKLQSIEAKALAAMGYSEPIIQQAFNQLDQEGVEEPTTDALLDVIHALEDNGELEKQTTSKLNRSTTTATQSCSLNNSELEPGVAEIQRENEQLKASNTCKVCLEKDVHAVFLPCGHLVCCMQCSEQVETCPLCRTKILGSVKAYRA